MCLCYGSQTPATLHVQLPHWRESASESGVRVRREGQRRHAARVRLGVLVCVVHGEQGLFLSGARWPRPSSLEAGFQRTPHGSGLMVRQMQESARRQEAWGGLGESVCEGVSATSSTAVGPT